MAKSDFERLFGKVKNSSNEMFDAAKETAGDILRAAKYKSPQAPNTADKKVKPEADNIKPKAKLDDELHLAVGQYNEAYTAMNDNGTALYIQRIRAVDLIVNIENLVNSIANRPKEFDTEIAEIKIKRKSFTGACEFAKLELENAKKSALGAGAGIAAGAAVVSIAPTAAIWIATTFGTASTGTAISALSGAAATNAALAWLGGGALAAGGGGMAAGNALLALAGPVGWGIAGATLLSSVVLFSVNKMQLDKKKKEEIEAVKKNTNEVQKIDVQIRCLIDEVVSLWDKLNLQYSDCLVNYGCDFRSISQEQQMQLGALVNNTKSLAVSLSKSVQ